ncbi:UNVERIFIED_CONTAM: hypothetical protein Slati_0938500 [Sesamum latifolium]|uniref:Retrotransposon gag domain-containing protein n=1 Tax=Sesamum latifolium TaxID=2727402 RepID=A0AAW2XQU9_9LAMI
MYRRKRRGYPLPEDQQYSRGMVHLRTPVARSIRMSAKRPSRCATPGYRSTPRGVESWEFPRVKSLLLHQFASSRKHRKTELSLFSIRQRDGEPLKEYLQQFAAAALEVPLVTQEVKASVFSQGLLGGDFFKSLGEKPASIFDALLARTAKYINIEDAQASKRERREKKKRRPRRSPLQEASIKLLRQKATSQRTNLVYIPLNAPIT